MLWIIVFGTLLHLSQGCQQSKEQPKENQNHSDEKPALSGQGANATDAIVEQKNEILKNASSTLQFPVDFPIPDLALAVNRVLPPILLEKSLSLNKKGDKLDLTITSIGKMSLASRGEKLYASIPVEIEAVISKKVVGIRLANKEPLRFSMDLGIETTLALGDNWQLETQCRLTRREWITEPEVKVLMLNINLKNLVDDQITLHQNEIESAICSALEKLVPIRREIEKIWRLMNEPHLIAREPVSLWLDGDPKVFSAMLDQQARDTLRVNIYVNTDLIISAQNPKAQKLPSLPANKHLEVNDYNLDLHPKLYASKEVLEKNLQMRVIGKRLAYEGYYIEISDASLELIDNYFKIILETAGDLSLGIEVLAQPALSEDLSLIFTDIQYTIRSDNYMINAADWLVNASFTKYLKDKAVIPLAILLESLDQKIIKALNTSKTGTSLGLDISFASIKSKETIYEPDRLIWLFDIQGDAHLYLKDELIQ